MITSKYFKESEFNRCVPSCTLQDMNQVAMDKLDEARELAGIPFVINCAYRSKQWDLNKGRNGLSAHTSGYAVDIRCNTDKNRFKIIEALIKAGFKRIGIAKTFIHADCSPSHSQEVSWLY